MVTDENTFEKGGAMPSIGQFSALKMPEANLPNVTFGMVVDFLGKNKVIYGPASSKRVFRWLKVNGAKGFEPSEDIRVGQLLHVCRIEHAQPLLKENPEAFVCASTHADTVPNWARSYEGRFMLVKHEDAFLYFCFLIMKLFTDALLLRSQLDHAVRDECTLQALLVAAQPAINADLACVDASGYELARANRPRLSNTGAPRKEKPALETDADDPQKAHANNLRGADAGTPHEANAPTTTKREILAEGLPFATMIMTTEDEPSAGQVDLFELACDHAQELCRTLWDEQSHIFCPHRQLLVDLIEGRSQDKLSNEEAKAQMRLTDAVQFKLIILSQDDTRRMSFANVASRAKLINRKRCHVFAYHGSICALCHAGEGDKLLSHQRTLADVRKHLGKLGVTAVSSQIFESLLDLDLAYEQAEIARGVRPLIMKEEGATSAEGKHDVVPFEVCLIYYLIGEGKKNERLLNFTFSHTLMQKLSMEDAANGTDYLDMFWHYLLSERNATAVAERLHVHRNTVLYRMNKIQERFDLDLADPDVREKMIIDFKMFFLLQSQRKDNMGKVSAT